MSVNSSKEEKKRLFMDIPLFCNYKVATVFQMNPIEYLKKSINETKF